MKPSIPMSMRYFKLSEDVYVPGRWGLGNPLGARGEALGSPVFLQGEPVNTAGPIHIPLYQQGKPLDFSLADAGTVPVVHSRVGDLLTKMAPHDVQLFPVEVEMQREQYFLVNVIRIIKCIDDQASEEVSYWTEKDGLPEKVGTYFSVAGMRIDPTKVGNAKVFRTWGWHIALIVSEELKEALEGIRATGMKFKQV
jgi:hypothetical protein